MLFFKRKGFALTAITLLSVIILSTFLVLLINGLRGKEDGSMKMHASASGLVLESHHGAETSHDGTQWVVDDRNGLHDWYHNNSIFIIQDKVGWDAFINLNEFWIQYNEWDPVNGHTYIKSYPYTFKYKTIILACDLTVDYDYIDTFYGIFDGNGHTITYKNQLELEGTNGAFCGILNSEATIKNLKIKNANILAPSSSGSTSYIGAIAGHNKGTIESCIVENCTFVSNRWLGNCYAGAIAGKNSGTIKNCLVTGKYSIGGLEGSGLVSDADGIRGSHFVASFLSEEKDVPSTERKNATHSVFNADIITKFDGADYDCFEDGKVKHPIGTLSGNLYNTQRDSFSSLGNNLEKGGPQDNENGGPQDNENGVTSAWYFSGEDYNDGWPMLRAFMSWQTINFVAEDGGDVNPKEIELPQDIDTTAFKNVSTKTLTLYNQKITATHPNDSYKVSSWKWSEDNKTYTVHFALDTISIYFKNVSDYITMSCSDDVQPGKSIDVVDGSTINMKYHKIPNRIVVIDGISSDKRCHCLVYVEYRFTIAGNDEESWVKYEVNDNKYFIGIDVMDGLPQKREIRWSDRLFGYSHDAYLKEYNITIG